MRSWKSRSTFLCSCGPSTGSLMSQPRAIPNASPAPGLSPGSSTIKRPCLLDMTASNKIPPARRARRTADAISRCHESTSAAAMTAIQRRPGGPKRILLVDDDAGVRGSLSDVLVSEEYVVIPANDGQQAIELAGTMPL